MLSVWNNRSVLLAVGMPKAAGHLGKRLHYGRRRREMTSYRVHDNIHVRAEQVESRLLVHVAVGALTGDVL